VDSEVHSRSDTALNKNSRTARPPTLVIQPSTKAGVEEPHRTAPPESGDFGHLLRLIWQRKLLLVAFLVGGMVLCSLIVVQVTPGYTAKGLLLVGAPQTHIVDLQAVLSGASAETDAVDSEIEVLQSPFLAGAVVDRLSLDRNPEFNPLLRSRTILDEVGSILEYFQHLASGEDTGAKGDPSSSQTVAAAQRADVVRNVLGSLSVSPRERSRLLDVAFTSEDPNLAAEIVNALLDLYISQQVDRKYSATLSATEALSRNVTTWERRTSDSERKIEEFRAQADLLEGEKGILVLGQLSATNDQLTAAAVARSLAEARLRQIERYGIDATLDGAEQQLRSPVLAGLHQREAQLMATEAEMRAKYGADHPRVASVQFELQNLRDVMAGEVDRVIQGVKIELKRDQAVEDMLSENLERLKRQVAAANMARVELDALRREADANRRILDVFTSRLAETRGQADRGILQPDASIITHAAAPLLPSYPKPKLYFASTLVLAIGAGLLFITLAETLRRGFCSGDEIERATGVPVVCLLPRVPGRGWLQRVSAKRFGPLPLARFLAAPRSVPIDRSVRWLGNCLFANGDQSRVVLLTSAKAGEGKTTAAVALARYLTQANCATVVIEADLCRPQLDKTVRIPASPGLRDLLRGTSSLDAVLYRDDASGVYTIPAGAVDLELHDALPWQAIEPLLASLRQRFDLVIIDGPPVLQAPEAGLLSRLSDATIFVVQWASTDRRMVTTGLDQIAQSGGRIGGMLLTMVNTRKYARYGIDDSHRFLLEGGRRSFA